MITVLLVDDHQLVRDALKLLLDAAGDIRVVATASNGQEAIEYMLEDCPNVAVLDISMPVMDGIEAARNLRLICPDMRILMLSMYDTRSFVVQSLNVGAHGYMLKDAASRELAQAVRVLHAGENFFSPSIAMMIRNL